MILVGTFDESDIAAGLDKIEIQKKKEETGLKYTETKLIYKNKKIVGIKVWVCSHNEFTI